MLSRKERLQIVLLLSGGLLALLIGMRFLLQGSSFCNENIFFGFVSSSLGAFLLQGLCLLGVAILFFRSKDFLEQLFFSILFISGFSNILERILYSCVSDYWILPFIGSHINLADVVITLSLMSLLWLTRRKSKS